MNDKYHPHEDLCDTIRQDGLTLWIFSLLLNADFSFKFLFFYMYLCQFGV